MRIECLSFYNPPLPFKDALTPSHSILYRIYCGFRASSQKRFTIFGAPSFFPPSASLTAVPTKVRFLVDGATFFRTDHPLPIDHHRIPLADLFPLFGIPVDPWLLALARRSPGCMVALPVLFWVG